MLYEWLAMLIGLVLATSVLRLPNPFWEKLYRGLAAPLGSVKRKKDRQVDLPFARGLLVLLATYFFTGVIFALSAGTAGYFAAEQTTIQVPFRQIAGMKCGFIVGLLLAAFARIRSIVASSALADQLSALATVTLGILVFLVPVSIAGVGLSNVAKFMQYPRDEFFSAPIVALLSSLVFVLVVEGFLFIPEYLGSSQGRQTTRWGLRMRMEQDEVVEQVCWHARVQTETDRLITDVIRSEGVQNVCWMTCTAPRSHPRSIHDASVFWTGAHCDLSQTDPGRLSQAMISANVRIIVPSKDIANEICGELPAIIRCRITGKIGAVFRTRLLILNRNLAIVHLPIPFSNEPLEQANYAAIIRSVEGVHEIQSWFDQIWENLRLQDIQETICGMLTSGKRTECALFGVLCEYEHGISLQDLQKILRKRHIVDTDSAIRNEWLQTLIEKKLIFQDPDTALYYPARRHMIGHALDSITRLIHREVVFAHTPVA